MAPGSGEPRLSASPDGDVVLSWLEPSAEDYELKYAVLGPAGWGAATTVARGADFVVNAADLPSVQPITAELWAAHWLVSSETSRFAYDIAIATSRDGGRHWGERRLLNDDGTEAEHGFVTLFAWDGDVGAVWLDGRELAEFHEQDPTAPELETTPVGTNLRFARLDRDATVVEQGVVDRLACDCCQTAVAVTERGPLVAYRDRTEGEIRDIVVRRTADGGWTEPVKLGSDNWQIEGCPVNGPALASQGREIVAAWFTAAEDRARILVARSHDGGANFQPPVEVDTDGAFGHVDVVLADDAAIVSWWRRSASGGTQLSVRAHRRRRRPRRDSARRQEPSEPTRRLSTNGQERQPRRCRVDRARRRIRVSGQDGFRYAVRCVSPSCLPCSRALRAASRMRRCRNSIAVPKNCRLR